jgi:hypothetical protein
MLITSLDCLGGSVVDSASCGSTFLDICGFLIIVCGIAEWGGIDLCGGRMQIAIAITIIVIAAAAGMPIHNPAGRRIAPAGRGGKSKILSGACSTRASARSASCAWRWAASSARQAAQFLKCAAICACSSGEASPSVELDSNRITSLHFIDTPSPMMTCVTVEHPNSKY